MKTLKKKLSHFITNIFLEYRAYADILKFYEVLFKTIPKIGNENEQ